MTVHRETFNNDTKGGQVKTVFFSYCKYSAHFYVHLHHATQTKHKEKDKIVSL